MAGVKLRRLSGRLAALGSGGFPAAARRGRAWAVPCLGHPLAAVHTFDGAHSTSPSGTSAWWRAHPSAAQLQRSTAQPTALTCASLARLLASFSAHTEYPGSTAQPAAAACPAAHRKQPTPVGNSLLRLTGLSGPTGSMAAATTTSLLRLMTSLSGPRGSTAAAITRRAQLRSVRTKPPRQHRGIRAPGLPSPP